MGEVKITDPDELAFLIEHQGRDGVPLLRMPHIAGGPEGYFADADELDRWRAWPKRTGKDERRD